MRPFRICSGACLALLALQLQAATPATTPPTPLYAALRSQVLLENERVLVEKFVLPPGQATGRHVHPGDQLLVFIKGGVLSSVDTGRSTLWRDGRVVWANANEPADAGTRNAGSAPIVMIWVTVKPVPPNAAPRQRNPADDKHLNYPNIPGEDLLENERIIVQRFIVNPGQWEGIHAHRPNMLYIHIKGGQWAARSNKEAEHPYPQPSPDAGVGWMPTIDISEGHESGNIGSQPIDLIWVTLKD
jgi:quercetin dioxygenase-like cupin family protein